MSCKHEEDIDYGKSIDITDNVRAIQILCVWCGAVGTQIEQRDEIDTEHWYSIAETWHELKDYYANSFIKERKYKGIGVNKWIAKE